VRECTGELSPEPIALPVRSISWRTTMTTMKWICGLLIALLAIGPFTAVTAMAQVAPPPPPPGPPPGAPPTMAPVPPPPPMGRQPSQGAAVGAGFLNVVYVPGKAIACGAGTLSAAALMVLTFGTAYHAAVSIFNEGCSGPWALTAYDVADVRPPEEPY
jgi:hypothetical protein